MKLTNVEKKEKNQVVLSITVEADVFEAACEKSYRKNAHSINIQGFRKGHAPHSTHTDIQKRNIASVIFHVCTCIL